MLKPFAVLVVAVALGACGSEPSGEPAAAGITIPDVQGYTGTSPLEGRRVEVAGVVTGDFQDGDADESANLGGFYLQDPAGDGDPATSDGVFVYGRGPGIADVEAGDAVRVTGRAQEYFGETQIVAERVTVTGTGRVAASEISLPTEDAAVNADGMPVADLERFEGMYVRFPQELTVTDLYELGEYGALRLSAGGRLYQYTNAERPDVDGYRAHRREAAARTLMLDDGLRESAPRPISYGDGGVPPRAGDTVGDLAGNLRYSRGSGGKGREDWRLMPVERPAIERASPRPDAPPIAGAISIAAVNLSNYFAGIDDGRADCGPRASMRCRGADSEAERRRQLAKIGTALAMLDADVFALSELENNADAAIADVAGAINRRTGNGPYSYVDTGVVGDDAIRPGLLYDPASVAPLGPYAVLDATVDPRFNDDRNRPAIAQTFRVIDGGAIFTVVVNHLKSKGSACDEDGDPNKGDGQGNCNLTRAAAALALADWLAADPTGSGDPDVLITGDLNAYLEEDPIVALEAAGYVNLLDRIEDTPYTYLHRGQAGALDHALASRSFAAQAAESRIWHVNADESPLIDYNLDDDRDPALFDPETPYRFGDHDPVIVGFDPQ